MITTTRVILPGSLLCQWGIRSLSEGWAGQPLDLWTVGARFTGVEHAQVVKGVLA